jgi:hypothetical protein
MTDVWFRYCEPFAWGAGGRFGHGLAARLIGRVVKPPTLAVPTSSRQWSEIGYAPRSPVISFPRGTLLAQLGQQSTLNRDKGQQLKAHRALILLLVGIAEYCGRS